MGQLIKKTTEINTGSIRRIVYEYDDFGRKLAEVFYRKEIENIWVKYQERIFQYYNEGALSIEKMIEKTFLKNKTVELVRLKKFDYRGNMVEINLNNVFGLNKYDEHGDIIERRTWREVYNENGNLYIQHDFTTNFDNFYDEKNRLIKRVERCFEIGNRDESIFEYDRFGRIKSKNKIGSNPKNNTLIEYFYDAPNSNVLLKNNELEIFPMPVSTKLNFNWSGEEKGDLTYKVFDINGRLVGQGILNRSEGAQSINVENLKSGWYSIFVFQGGALKSGEFIIQE